MTYFIQQQLKILKCPRCGGEFSEKLLCKECRYSIKHKKNVLIFDEFMTKEMKKENKVNERIIHKEVKNTPFKKYYAEFDKSGVYLAEKIIRDLIKEKKLKKNSVFVELGCGYGWITYMMSKYTDKTYKTDIFYEFLEKLDTPSILLPMQNTDAIFKKESVDIVWVQAAIHHSPELEPVFTAVRKILKKDGVFIVSGELMSGVMIKNQRVKVARKLGFQDVPYHMHDYLNAAKKCGFKTQAKVSYEIDYFFTNPEYKVETKWKKNIVLFMNKMKLSNAILTLLHYFPFNQVYLFLAEMIGLPVLIICRKKQENTK